MLERLSDEDVDDALQRLVLKLVEAGIDDLSGLPDHTELNAWAVLQKLLKFTDLEIHLLRMEAYGMFFTVSQPCFRDPRIFCRSDRAASCR
jgi:hypothetical protein